MFKFKKNILLLLVFTPVLIFFTNCVDTSVESIPESITYYSELKFTNLVTGAGSATLTLNGAALGSVNFGSEIPGTQSEFLTVPAGSKTLEVNFGNTANTLKFASTTDRRMRIFIIGTTNSNEIITSTQRYIWQTKDSESGQPLFPSDKGQIAFFNGSPDGILNSVTFSGAADSTIEFENPLALGQSVSYIKLKPGSYNMDVLYNDTLHVTFNGDLLAKGRYTAVLYDAAANLKNAIFVDD